MLNIVAPMIICTYNALVYRPIACSCVASLFILFPCYHFIMLRHPGVSIIQVHSCSRQTYRTNLDSIVLNRILTMGSLKNSKASLFYNLHYSITTFGLFDTKYGVLYNFSYKFTFSNNLGQSLYEDAG
jgi:hypothetical protein